MKGKPIMNTLKNTLSKITKIGFAKTFSLLVERIKLKKILKADSLEERFDMISQKITLLMLVK